MWIFIYFPRYRRVFKKTFTFNPELQILTRRKERRIDFSSNTGFLIFIPICLSTKSVKNFFFSIRWKFLFQRMKKRYDAKKEMEMEFSPQRRDFVAIVNRCLDDRVQRSVVVLVVVVMALKLHWNDLELWDARLINGNMNQRASLQRVYPLWLY